MVEQTSIQDYYENKNDGSMGRMEKIVLDGFIEFGDHTDREMTELLGFKDPNSVRPRRNRLCKDDMRLMERKGKRKCEITGKKAIVWGLV